MTVSAPEAVGMRNTAWHNEPCALFTLNSKQDIITEGDL